MGGTANRVIQYMTARSLIKKSGAEVSIFSKYGIPEFNINPNPPPEIKNHKHIKSSDY